MIPRILRGESRPLFTFLLLLASATHARADLYTGLYFHRFTGADEGSEWSTWGKRTGVDRYEFADLSAQGRYPGSITPDGDVTLDNSRGTGSFHSPDDADIHFTLPGGVEFHSHIRRAPYTDSNFPVFLPSTVSGNETLRGEWNARVLDVDPETGSTLATRDESWTVVVLDNTIRLTRADGEYLQGAWATTTQAAFRVIDPDPPIARYKTFDGSETSLDLDTLGDLRVLDDRSMTLAVFFQTRAPFGEQAQSMQYVELTRVPSPAGWASLGIVTLILGARNRR